MKKIYLFIALLPFYAYCQNTIGFPDIINYSKQTYSGGLQNWHIKQDKNGIIYIANNEGLLSFDGKNWNLYPLPNKTIVRSVEIGSDNKIYVGGQDEIGYFTPDKNGKLQYFSLNQFILPTDKSFGDVWDIVAFNKDVFIRTSHKIFRFINESVATFDASSEWTYLTNIKGSLYAHDLKTGLKRFENDAWTTVSTPVNPLVSDPVTSILPLHKDSLLVSTLKNGLFVMTKGNISKLQSVNNQLFQNERIYAATKINDEWIALATSNGGVFIIDSKGNIVQSFSKTDGLQNNNVLSIFLDNQSNLWLGLDNGVDLITYNSAIKEINPSILDGSGYTATIFNNKLFVGTSNGLYSVGLEQNNDLSFSKGNFQPVNNTKGQTWGLSVINNQLLLGNHDGAFVIKDNTAVPLEIYPGYWNFTPVSNTFPTSQIIAGNYNGISLFDFKDGQFHKSTENIPDFKESSRFIAIDKFENIWVSHPYHGIYRVKKQMDGHYKVFNYQDKKGLPSLLNNHVFKIKNEVLFATENGIYIYNEQKDTFEASEYYHKLLGSQSIRYLKEDATGNVWFIHEKNLGVIDYTGKEPSVIYLSELHNKLLSGFEFIYPVNQNNIFIGGEKGFFHINYEKYKRDIPELKVQVREVHIVDKTDSLLFGGYFKGVNDPQIQDADRIPEVANNWKSIRFDYCASLFGYLPNLEYSYRLKGFDDNWSDWSTRTEKEFTRLPAGKYTLEVKIRSNLGKESPVAAYSFRILPPWYLTIWAYILYLILIIIGNYSIYYWLKNKFRAQKARYEAEQKRLMYIHELELSKTESELVSLRNMNLETEINFKNSELASSAMHLYKKGDLISKIKAALMQLIKTIDNPQAVSELKKMVKTLNEDDQMDEEWNHFTKHFDKVHSDFLSRLKDMHPTISPNELKLSAYLRMNLSTKEIAQLMNISARGVEVSRYRLRKKLELPTEVTLFDYLINIKSNDKEGGNTNVIM